MAELVKRPRPHSVPSKTIRVRLACGNMYITISYLDGKVFEVFATIGKSGGCIACHLSALSLAITLGIRYGIPLDDYIKKLIGISCPSFSIENGVNYYSCIDALAQTLQNKQKELKETSGV